MKPTKISAALATATITTTLLTPTAQALQPGDKYVALGDSYASTGTITQPVPGSTPACVKDQDNYPHQLAKQLNLQLDDASCAWAFTYQYDNPPTPRTPPHRPNPTKTTPDTRHQTRHHHTRRKRRRTSSTVHRLRTPHPNPRTPRLLPHRQTHNRRQHPQPRHHRPKPKTTPHRHRKRHQKTSPPSPNPLHRLLHSSHPRTPLPRKRLPLPQRPQIHQQLPHRSQQHHPASSTRNTHHLHHPTKRPRRMVQTPTTTKHQLLRHA